jgi:predicted Zn-dependent protease
MTWGRSFLLVVLLASSGLGACSSQRELARSHNVLMSTLEEEEVGEEASEEVERKLGFIGDAPVREYVSDVGERLARNSPRREIRYRFEIVEMEEPNAFALPGGHIYISRGLLALANSEQELANVLAHEVAHVALQHHAYRELEVRRTKWLGALAVLAGALAGGAGGAMVAAQGWMVAGQGMLAAYTRDQEREADWLGQEIARNAGWDPLAMASFLRSLDRHARLQLGASRLPGYFDTHPGSLERQAKASVRYEHAAPLPDDALGRQKYLEQVEGIVVGQNPDEGLFDGPRFLHPGLGFTLRFPDDWRTVNEHAAVRAVSPLGNAMVILELQGEGDDPEAAAREYAEKAEVSLSGGDARRINGNRAYQARTTLDLDGSQVKADVTWIAHEDHVYRIMAVVPARRLIPETGLDLTARSFRRLSASERDGVRVTRLRVTPVEPGEDLDELSRRTNNHWSRDETAVMNGLSFGEAPAEGVLLKVAVPEPWRPRDDPALTR